MAEKPELIILNGCVWTGGRNCQRAEAVAVQGRHIAAVGTTSELRGMAGSHTRIVDAGGNFVMPGVIDNHTHLMIGGLQLLNLDLRDVHTKQEFIAAIRERAAAAAPGSCIIGGGWNDAQWQLPEMPAKEWIDGFTADIPVMLNRSDMHIGYTNSAALRLAGITADTPDPQGGVIARDAHGEPTGILKDNANRLLLDAFPKPTVAEYDAGLLAAMRHAATVGVTSVQDVTAWRDWNDWAAFRRCQEQHKLTLRIYARTQISEWEKQLTLVSDEGFKNDSWLRLGGVKGFVDGSLGSGTALMFEPYEDEPDNCGIFADQMLPEGIMLKRIMAADKAGLPVSIHAIGDRANSLLIDIYEEVARTNGYRDRRFRIEHAQHLRTGAAARMAKLGILASLQPAHLYDDGALAEQRLGHERCCRTYAFKTLQAAGVPISFGTDWPVVPLDPFWGIYIAATRQLAGIQAAAFQPAEQMAVEMALQAYTSGSAYAEFAEQEKGSLEVGKLADIVIASQNILTVPVEEIPKTKVLMTIADGRVIYEH